PRLRPPPPHPPPRPPPRPAHVPADQESQSAEHLLLLQAGPVPDQLTDPTRQLLVVGHAGILFATRADEARATYERAVYLVHAEPERRLLEQRLAELQR